MSQSQTPTSYVPTDVTRMECLVVLEVLRRIRHATLNGTPSGQAIDDATKEAVQRATSQAG